jgi:hypothetical protein
VILPRFHIIPRFERGEPLEQSEAVDWASGKLVTYSWQYKRLGDIQKDVSGSPMVLGSKSRASPIPAKSPDRNCHLDFPWWCYYQWHRRFQSRCRGRHHD